MQTVDHLAIMKIMNTNVMGTSMFEQLELYSDNLGHIITIRCNTYIVFEIEFPGRGEITINRKV